MAYQEEAIVQSVWDLVKPMVEDYGLELVDVEYLRQPGGWIIRIILDKEGGVTLDDCTKVSRELGYLLEVKDFIDHPYNLEVSSPGLDRPLKTETDFVRFIGNTVSVKTGEPVEGRRNFKGTLLAFENGEAVLDIQGKSWKIPFNCITKAKLVYEF